jgi:hypothetical protein
MSHNGTGCRRTPPPQRSVHQHRMIYNRFATRITKSDVRTFDVDSYFFAFGSHSNLSSECSLIKREDACCPFYMYRQPRAQTNSDKRDWSVSQLLGQYCRLHLLQFTCSLILIFVSKWADAANLSVLLVHLSTLLLLKMVHQDAGTALSLKTYHLLRNAWGRESRKPS